MNRDKKYVPSPCVNNCCLDNRNICLGCFRSVAEITRWEQADSELRHQILERARRRKQDDDYLKKGFTTRV